VILPESPKALVGDGALATAAIWVLHNVASATIWALTIAILLFRAIILYRQVRAGK
jgi:hypothetical protein